jgi:hypothetical protein
VVAVLLFLFTVPGDGTRATHLGDPGMWCRVPWPTLGGPGTLVGQSEECGESLHVMRGQLLQHFFITYSLTEGRDDGSIGNAGDKRPESLPGFLPHCVEVGLHAVLLVSAGEVRCEPRAEIFPGID